MGTRTRYVVVGILILAVFAAVSLSHGLSWVWVQLDWDDASLFAREMTLTRIIAFSVAFGSAVFVLKHAHTFKLANEVVDELSKVSWPSREETGNATIVVLVAVLICSVYLGIFDAIWLSLTNFILGVNPS